MSILHLLQVNNGNSPAVVDCLASTNPGDTVVVISDAPASAFDGVFASLQEQSIPGKFLPVDPENHARSSGSKQIDYAALVELTCKYPRIVSWF